MPLPTSQQHRPLKTTAVLLAIVLFANGCDQHENGLDNKSKANNSPDPADTPPEPAVSAPSSTDVTTASSSCDSRRKDRINQVALTLHQQAIDDSGVLQHAIETFIETTTDEHLTSARAAWQSAHASLIGLWAIYQAGPLWHYLQQPRQAYSLFSALDAAPLLPGYLDSVPGYPRSGVVSALDIPLNASNLKALHQHADREFVVLGLHPLEFFLWQQADLFRHPTQSNGKLNTITPADEVDSRKDGAGKKQNNEDDKDSVKEVLQGPTNQLLIQRRKQLITSLSREYRAGLIRLKQQWQNQQFAEVYLAQTSDAMQSDSPILPNEADGTSQPLLLALMSFIDRYIVEQLEVSAASSDYRFNNHFRYSGTGHQFWPSVIQGIHNLARLHELPAQGLEPYLRNLFACLSKLKKPATEPVTANSPLPCKREISLLQEWIILNAEKKG